MLCTHCTVLRCKPVGISIATVTARWSDCKRPDDSKHIPVRPGDADLASGLQQGVFGTERICAGLFCKRHCGCVSCAGPLMSYLLLSAFLGNSSTFVSMMSDLDELVGTQPLFLLGSWIANATRWGHQNASVGGTCDSMSTRVGFDGSVACGSCTKLC